MQNGAALTRQILEFSQRQMGDARIGHVAAMDLNGVLAGLEPDLRRLISPETSLRLSLCADSTPVLADPGHIRQIVTSFVIHAREFGGGASIIEVATTVEPDGPAAINTPSLEPAPGNSVRELLRSAVPFVSLSVRGEAEQGAAAQPGEHPTHETESALLPGNARPWIGMATSQAILAQYGGMMTAVIDTPTADSGKGVRYSLYLPLAPGAKTGRAVASPAQPVATVLLVEEEPLIRELSREMLERQGFEVLTAGTVDEAKRLAATGEHFDVLITPAPARTHQSASWSAGPLHLRLFRRSARLHTAPPERGNSPKTFLRRILARKVRELLSKTQTAAK